VIIVNTGMTGETLPEGLADLLDPGWKGRACFANPLFGTTGTHLAALYSVWGATETRSYFRELVAENQAAVLPGNAQVKNAVAAGRFAAGLTDTDDAHLALLAGKPVDIVFPDSDGMGTLLIPNTVSLIAGGPHAEEGKRLIDFLLSRSVEEALCRSRSAQIPLRTDVAIRPDLPHIETARWMEVDFEEVARQLEESAGFARELSRHPASRR
jgi:iron(III) transport system substrate-binding protein